MSNRFPHRTVSLLALAVTGGLPTDEPVRIEFAPAAGQVTSKHFEIYSSMEVDDLELIVNGEDVESMIGDIEFLADSTVNYVFIDEFVESAEGRPIRFAREYESALTEGEYSFGVMGFSQSDSIEATVPMTGHRVLFRLDESGESYLREFDQETPGDRELLKGLAEQTGLRDILPSKPVKPGDSWKVSNRLLKQLMQPGGFLGAEFDSEDWEDLGVAIDVADVERMTEQIMAESFEMFDALLEGTSEASFAGMVRRNGTKVARIDLEVDVEIEVDLISMLDGMLNSTLQLWGTELIDLDMSFDIERAELAYELEGELTVFWDLELGLLAAADAELDSFAEADLRAVIGFEDEAVDIEVTASVSSPLGVKIRTEGK